MLLFRIVIVTRWILVIVTLLMTPNYPTSYICFTTYKPEKPPSTVNHYPEEEFAPGSRRIQEVVNRPSACPVSQSRKRKLINSLIITAIPAPRHNPALLLLIAFPWQLFTKKQWQMKARAGKRMGAGWYHAGKLKYWYWAWTARGDWGYYSVIWSA